MRDAFTSWRALPRGAWLALLASAVAHGAWLWRLPGPSTSSQPAPAVSVQLAPPRLPLPDTAEPAPPPAPAAHTARPPQAERPAAPPAPAAAATVEPPPPSALLRLAGPAAWRYRLRQAGQDGEAVLDWQPQPDGRYTLRLTRRIGERALPAWESLGRVGSAGLSPERFALQRGGQDRQAVNFDHELGQVSFSASPAQRDLPEGAQDRLSWWLQLAALVQASPAAATAPGGRWRVWVAGLRGELREWVFEAMTPDADDAGLLHVRRLPLGEHDPGLDLWLDPARLHWPVRLRQGDPEARGYEIRLVDVNS